MRGEDISRGPDDPLVRAFSYPYERAARDGALDLASGVLRPLRVRRILPAPDRPVASLSGPVPCCLVETEAAIGEARRHLLLAAGSNASPAQLMRKFRGRGETQPILLFNTWVADLIAVHSAHVIAYGAVAATLMAWSGASSRLTVLAVTERQLRRVNETESLGRNYRLAVLPAGTIGNAPACPVLAYRSLHGVFAPAGVPLRLAAFAAEGDLPGAVSQAEALAACANTAGDGGPLAGFVRRLVGDRAFRNAATRAMAARAVADGLAELSSAGSG